MSSSKEPKNKRTRLSDSQPRLSVEAVKESGRSDIQKRLDEKLEELKKKSPAPKSSKNRKTKNGNAASASSPKTPVVSSSSSAQSPQVMTASTPAAHRHNFTGFVLDCDGVIWHGDDPIEGSIEACNKLIEMGCKVHYVTNSSSNTRENVASKLRRLGVTGAKAEHVTTSGSAAANLIREKLPSVKRVYVVGEQGLLDELKAVGLKVEGGPEENDATAQNSQEFLNLEINSDVGAVVCALDRRFNYAKLAKASLHLQRGCPMVCTNLDAYDVLPPKGNVPGAGCIAAALLASHPDAKQYVSGKPSGDVLLDIMKRRGMEKSMTVMIGDRVDTDIKFAQNAGVHSCLVLTGVCTEEHREMAMYCHQSLSTFVNECFPK